MSPCPSFGRCWPRFPSASLAGGWPTAATGSDAGILMANQESDEDSCPERPGGAEGPLCIPWKESALRSIATKVLSSYPARQVVLRSVATKEFSSTSQESTIHGYCFTLPRDFIASLLPHFTQEALSMRNRPIEILRNRLPHIRQRVPHSQVHARPACGRIR